MSLFKRQKTGHNFGSSPDYLQFNGNIIYHNSVETTDKIVNKLMAEEDLANNKIVVGFDCEWKAFPRPSKVCLIQMCWDSDECHLFHLSAMNYKIPTSLLSLISHPNCLKVGLNIDSDIFKLQRDYNLSLDDVVIGSTKSTVDLSEMANNLLGMSCRWSLSRLSEHLLKKPIQKDLACSNWSKIPLSSEQERYAAIDAFASYELYYEIKANTKLKSFD